jgi:threonine synthase
VPVLPSLFEGNTPLIEAYRLQQALGIGRLLLKDERRNPTGSFKDRGTVVAVHRALDLGLNRVGTVSTGNMGASMAAYAARAGLTCFVLMSATISLQKLGPIAIHRPHLIAVDGDYGDLYFRSLEIGPDLGIYFANGDDPFRVEGQKTIAYEIWEALGGQMPDCILLPVSSGGNTGALLKGIGELLEMGALAVAPTVIGVQAEGASPIAKAYVEGKTQISRFPCPQTVAHAIANPYPPSGNRVLRQLRAYGRGRMMTVSDEEILDAQSVLAAEEGMFAQPAACAPLAAVRKLLRDGELGARQSVVCVITGDGLKDPAALEHHKIELQTVGLGELREAVEQCL